MTECLCTVLSDVKDKFEETETVRIITGLDAATCLYSRGGGGTHICHF